MYVYITWLCVYVCLHHTSATYPMLYAYRMAYMCTTNLAWVQSVLGLVQSQEPLLAAGLSCMLYMYREPHICTMKLVRVCGVPCTIPGIALGGRSWQHNQWRICIVKAALGILCMCICLCLCVRECARAGERERDKCEWMWFVVCDT